MKLKIVMDSGKEYITEKYKDVEDFLQRTTSPVLNVAWITLDEEETIYVNGANVSSIEKVTEK